MAVLLAACATSRPEASAAPKSEKLETTEPSPMPSGEIVPLRPIHMSPGETRRVSLVGADGGPTWNVLSAATEQPIGCDIILEQDAIILRAGPESNGRSLVMAEIELGHSPPGGNTAQSATPKAKVVFPLSIESIPSAEFVYTPAPGMTPEKIFAAGSFNSWSANTDELTKDESGVFRLSKPIPPGEYTYKLIVDEVWMPDPANPDSDGTSYNNSVMKVESASGPKFDFEFAPPGAGDQGAFKAALPKGVQINPATITLLLNNHRCAIDEWRIANAEGIITLNVKPENWRAKNYVTILADATDGSHGEISVTIPDAGGSTK